MKLGIFDHSCDFMIEIEVFHRINSHTAEPEAIRSSTDPSTKPETPDRFVGIERLSVVRQLESVPFNQVHRLNDEGY